MGPGAEERPAWANRPAADSVVTPATDQFKSCQPASALCSLNQLTGSRTGVVMRTEAPYSATFIDTDRPAESHPHSHRRLDCWNDRVVGQS